jgi:Fe-S cluster biogenesis protein NfuA
MTDVEARIQQALDRIRPAVQMDGGDIKFVAWRPVDRTLVVEMAGACSGCGSVTATMTMGVERVVKSLVPEVNSVEAV